MTGLPKRRKGEPVKLASLLFGVRCLDGSIIHLFCRSHIKHSFIDFAHRLGNVSDCLIVFTVHLAKIAFPAKHTRITSSLSVCSALYIIPVINIVSHFVCPLLFLNLRTRSAEVIGVVLPAGLPAFLRRSSSSCK